MGFAYAFYFFTFILSIVRPVWGFVGLVVSVLIRFQDRFPGIASIKPFTLLFLGMVIGCFVHKDKLIQSDWKQDKLLLVMLGVSFFGLILLEPGDLIGETWQFISSLAFYFFASRLLTEKKHYYVLFSAMSLCIAYMGYEAIESVTNFPETTPYIDPRSGRWQGIGYYENSNEFAQLMVTTMPFLFALVLIRKSMLMSIAAIACIGLMIYVIGKASSRTVMLILGMMVVLTVVLRGKGNVIKKSLVGGIIGALLLVGLTFVPGPIQDRLGTVLNAGSDSSFQGRTRAWGYGFDMLSWYPVTGVGKGQWMEYHGLMPHNSYVQIMAELGPVGIYAFIWILVLSFKEFRPFLSAGEEGQQKKKTVRPVWGEEPPDEAVPGKMGDTDKQDDISDGETEPIDQETKTLVISVIVIFVGWLVYILLGNQGYSVWTYFYIGLCASVRNLLPGNRQKVKQTDGLGQPETN
ncbi:O-antigen ligase family protein [Aliikangiella coralliicola]|uniref:O-antigen ligase-related domain-containing protein n=1 Tax=Aliikangiella coralliicola TaxID=2592383 RepID=A0A545UHD4_9GAMM|nr:O-antigen ligase family protein [Aliikangiella coralliicola]TQV88884.1 hypothetical protein FLL46_04945 [Aliikangiella coralliicola]